MICQSSIPSNTMGALCKILSGICFAGVNILLKSLAVRLPVIQVSCLQHILAAIFLFPYAKNASIKMFKKKECLVMLLFAIPSTLLWVYAMRGVPVANVVTLGFTGSIMTIIGSRIFFREKISAKRGIAISFGIIGGIMVAYGQCIDKIDFSVQQRAIYIIAPLLSCLAYSGISLMEKYLVKKDMPQDVTFFLLFGVGVALLPSIPLWVAPSLYECALLFAIGGLMVGAHLFVNIAQKRADLTFLLPFGSVRLIASASFGALFFGEIPNEYIIAGSFVIFVAIMVISYTRPSRI